jgi:hypothetical protein
MRFEGHRLSFHLQRTKHQGDPAKEYGVGLLSLANIRDSDVLTGAHGPIALFWLPQNNLFSTGVPTGICGASLRQKCNRETRSDFLHLSSALNIEPIESPLARCAALGSLFVRIQNWNNQLTHSF